MFQKYDIVKFFAGLDVAVVNKERRVSEKSPKELAFRYETGLIALAFALAIVLRLLKLGDIPLSDDEARWALQACLMPWARSRVLPTPTPPPPGRVRPTMGKAQGE